MIPCVLVFAGHSFLHRIDDSGAGGRCAEDGSHGGHRQRRPHLHILWNGLQTAAVSAQVARRAALPTSLTRFFYLFFFFQPCNFFFFFLHQHEWCVKSGLFKSDLGHSGFIDLKPGHATRIIFQSDFYIALDRHSS